LIKLIEQYNTVFCIHYIGYNFTRETKKRAGLYIFNFHFSIIIIIIDIQWSSYYVVTTRHTEGNWGCRCGRTLRPKQSGRDGSGVNTAVAWGRTRYDRRRRPVDVTPPPCGAKLGVLLLVYQKDDPAYC